MQPQSIVEFVEILQTISSLHRIKQSLEFGKDKRQKLFIAQRRQMGSGLGVISEYQIVNANSGRRVAQIDAAAEVADRTLLVDR